MSLPGYLAEYGALFAEIGNETGLDPYLLAAICSRESLGGRALVPPGPGGTGDEGNGLGLMQIDRRYHSDWANLANWRDPETNIRKGASILADNLRLMGGCVPAMVAAYNASPARVRRVLSSTGADSPDLVAELDKLTTGHNYVSDVLARRDRFASATQASPPPPVLPRSLKPQE